MNKKKLPTGLIHEPTLSHRISNLPNRGALDKAALEALNANIPESERFAHAAAANYGIVDRHAITAIAHTTLWSILASHPELSKQSMQKNLHRVLSLAIKRRLIDYNRSAGSSMDERIVRTSGNKKFVAVSLDTETGDGDKLVDMIPDPNGKPQHAKAELEHFEVPIMELYTSIERFVNPRAFVYFLLYYPPKNISPASRQQFTDFILKCKDIPHNIKPRIVDEVGGGKELSMAEIGRLFGVTESNISIALSRIRKNVRDKNVLSTLARRAREAFIE